MVTRINSNGEREVTFYAKLLKISPEIETLQNENQTAFKRMELQFVNPATGETIIREGRCFEGTYSKEEADFKVGKSYWCSGREYTTTSGTKAVAINVSHFEQKLATTEDFGGLFDSASSSSTKEEAVVSTASDYIDLDDEENF